MNNDLVPVIDISGFFTGDPVKMQVVADQIAEACEFSGFFQIIGHGVAEEFISSVYDVSREFFDMPEEAKGEVRPTFSGPGARVVRCCPGESVEFARRGLTG